MTAPLLSGQREIDGKAYWTDAKGGLIPESIVKPADKLQDELVRKIISFALPLSAQVARFRDHCFDDVDAFVALLEQEYEVQRGGSKGNLTFLSYDGLLRVVVRVSETITFDAQLQVAKGLVDECLREWSAGSGPELQAIVNRAFDVDSEGRINRYNLFGLQRLAITDERWVRAMQAIRDSLRVIGSKRYIGMYQRADAKAKWQSISIDVASA